MISNIFLCQMNINVIYLNAKYEKISLTIHNVKKPFNNVHELTTFF